MMKPAGSAAVAVAMPGPGGWTTGRGASPGSGADGLLVVGTGSGDWAAETGEPNAAPGLCSLIRSAGTRCGFTRVYGPPTPYPAVKAAMLAHMKYMSPGA
jgi:hypothetical protein